VDLAATLLRGKTFRCQAVAAQGSGNWPSSIKFSGTPGAVKGDVTWTTLNSVHRIAGSLSGTAAPIDINGIWQSGLLDDRPDRETPELTATWKRDDLPYLPMPHGFVNPEKGHFTASADGNRIEAYSIVGDKRTAQTFNYHRDR